MTSNRPLVCAFFGTILVAQPALAQRHPVYSLVDNRPQAHLIRRGGLYIEAGGASFARYVHFSRPMASWKLRATEEGRKVALATAVATLEVPLTASQAAGKVVHLGLKSPAHSTVKITGQGKASAAITLQPGWQVVSVPMADGALVEGENKLTLNFAQLGQLGGQRSAAAVEFIQIGGSAPAKADAVTRGEALSIPKDGGAAFYVYLPESGALSATGDGAGCTVTATAGGAKAELRLDGTPLEWSAIGGRGGRFARLELSASGGCGAVSIKHADLNAQGAAPSLAARKPPRNIILWVSDSTRADKFKIYNPNTRVESPFFTELAKRATVFKVAYVQGNESRVSHASLFTSLYPGVHQMIAETAKLNSSFVTLAEAVKPSGRYTAGVMGNGFIDAFWGFGEGWDWLENHIHTGGGLRGEELLDSDKKLMAAHDSKPMFLYTGSIDAHVSWRAHEPWLAKYDTTPYSGPFVKACLDPQLDLIVAGKMKITDRDKVRIAALYDSDISYTDQVIKHLFDELDKRGHKDDTMVIFTADHGEEMWDHGKVGHGQSIHEELVHVPLVVYYPPYFPAGKVVEEGVDVLDILPTITDALGVATPDAVQGESLLPLASGIGAGYPRPSIASQYELAHTMRLAGYKLWVGGSGDVHLYDIPNDGHEDKDLWATRPIERRAVTDAMGLWLANRNQWKKRKWGVASNLLPGFAAEMEK